MDKKKEKKYNILITSGGSLMVGTILYMVYRETHDPAWIVFTVGLLLLLSPIFLMYLDEKDVQ